MHYGYARELLRQKLFFMEPHSLIIITANCSDIQCNSTTNTTNFSTEDDTVSSFLWRM